MRLTSGKLVLVLLFGISLITGRTYSQSITIPPRIQAALFLKIFKYESALRDKGAIKVLIVFDEVVESEKNELVRSMENASFIVNAVKPGELEENIADFDAAYFMQGLHEYGQVCKKYNVLSISTFPKNVEEGYISLAIGIYDAKPRIYVNLASLKREGSNISAELLRFAQVFE